MRARLDEINAFVESKIARCRDVLERRRKVDGRRQPRAPVRRIEFPVSDATRRIEVTTAHGRDKHSRTALGQGVTQEGNGMKVARKHTRCLQIAWVVPGMRRHQALRARMLREPCGDVCGAAAAQRDAQESRRVVVAHAVHAVDGGDAELGVRPRVDLRAREQRVHHGPFETRSEQPERNRDIEGMWQAEQASDVSGGHLADRMPEHRARPVAGGPPPVGVEDVDDRRDEWRIRCAMRSETAPQPRRQAVVYSGEARLPQRILHIGP
eukprot:4055668-Prymnesium_polylepis.1